MSLGFALALALLCAVAVDAGPRVPAPPPAEIPGIKKVRPPPSPPLPPKEPPSYPPEEPPATPPPPVRPPPPQTELATLVGTWAGSCSQRAVLNGTEYKGLTLIKWADDDAPSTCEDRALAEGLSVKYDIVVSYDGHGGITYSRGDVAKLYRKYHYYYGPAYGPVTANITGNTTYPLFWNCLEIENWQGDFGLTSMPKKTAWLVKEWQGVYYQYMLYNTSTNTLMDTCPGDPDRPSIMPFYCTENDFIVKCEATRTGSPPSVPPSRPVRPRASPPSTRRM